MASDEECRQSEGCTGIECDEPVSHLGYHQGTTTDEQAKVAGYPLLVRWPRNKYDTCKPAAAPNRTAAEPVKDAVANAALSGVDLPADHVAVLGSVARGEQSGDDAVRAVVDSELRDRFALELDDFATLELRVLTRRAIAKSYGYESWEAVTAVEDGESESITAAADAALAVVAHVLAERDAEIERLRRNAERDARVVDGLRGERITLWEERDKAASALAAIKDWKWERPPTLLERIELVASELDIARKRIEQLTAAPEDDPLVPIGPVLAAKMLGAQIPPGVGVGSQPDSEPRPWTEFRAGERATASDLDGRTVTGLVQSFFAWSDELGRNSRARMILDDETVAVVHAPSLRVVVDQPGGVT